VAILPTDRTVLRCIYDMYEAEYPGEKVGAEYKNDPYLAIDVRAVAAKLDTKPELLFGRLHADLGKRYCQRIDERTTIPLFSAVVGQRKHCVHFPYLAAVLAGLEQEFRRHMLSFWLSCVAIAISFGSLAVNLLSKH
jgi:hypothetical protein